MNQTIINKTTEFSAELNREQLLLFIGIRKKAFVSISLALVVAWALWDSLPAYYLLPWMGSIILIMSWRQYLIPTTIDSLSTDQIAPLTATIWKLTLGACFIWGIGAAFTMGHIAMQQEFLLIILLLGMNGAIMGYSTEKKYSVAVQMSLLPVVIALLLQGEATQIQIAVLLVLYIVFMQSNLQMQHDRFARSISVRFENNDLLEKLRHKIEEKEVIEHALKLKTDHAEEATRAKSLFLSIISHELRTPVHGLLGMLDLTHEAAMDKESKEQLGHARAAAHSLKTLVNDLLNLSKAESGLIALKIAPFEIEHCLREALIPCLVLADKQQDSITIAFENVPRTIHTDEGKLRQVIRNLSSNALKFTENGAVHIHICSHDNGKQQQLRVTIKDTGIGISAENLPTIFEPFVQAGSFLTQKFDGTGLGTSIAKHFVQQMGGDITAASTLGEGSSFSFTIDCLMEGDALNEVITDASGWLFKGNTEQRAADNAAFGQGLHILIAEDDEISRRIATKRLARAGFIVSEAENGRVAWDQARQMKFDLILLDLQMPGMGGIAVTQHIRTHECPNNKTVIIGLSAHATMDIRDEALASGMDAFLMKPIELESIVQHVQASMATKESTGHEKGQR